ncbi:guanine nucleotide exchange factor subunit RIC1-like [Clytia hemisphaerica]|uniref:guanine nucleotide exchange factor subunit RIC1-like n=1 Tax=Clytia hemisphaerica TaxID=252671 RepID=UPI0034D42A2A
MYFPIGWPKFYNSQLQTGKNDVLKIVRFNRSRSLFVTISDSALYLWKTRPRVVLAIWSRDEKQIHDEGINQNIYWNPNSSMLVLVTSGGFLIMIDVFEIENEFIYHLEQSGSSNEQLTQGGILKVELAHKVTITVKGKITSVSTRLDGLFVTTTEGWIYRFNWNGVLSNDLSTPIYDLVFCVDLDSPAPVGTPLTKNSEVYIEQIECSPVLGGYAVVFSDGRGGFLSSQTPEAKPSEIVGVFAKDLNNAICLSVNIKYQIIVFGQTNGQASAFIFDEATGGLVLSHKYILPKKDYPDEGVHMGSICSMAWTPDGNALGTIWSKCGVAIWSVFGSLLMCVETSDFGGDVFHHEAITLSSLDWSIEGYELLLVPVLPDEPMDDHKSIYEGDILSMKFVKSALAVNPCMSNRQHLFLQSDNSVYFNTGDVMLQNGGNGIFGREQGGVNSPSMHFSNKHWQTFPLPHNYIHTNWPIRYAAVDMSGKYFAVAGINGYAHFSLARRKWKLFGNETQERTVTCRGGLTWWNDYLIVGCFILNEDREEVRIHHRQDNLDVLLAQRISFQSPIFLINLYHNILMVYCSDCSVSFFRLQTVEASVHASRVTATKISETSLLDYLVHPITVTSISLSGLKDEQPSAEFSSEESNEAHSLIANVAGRVLMLQKDKPAAERGSNKITFLPPVVIATCVENIWYMVNPVHSTKQHLAESLWFSCGANGMQAWLPLFPTRRPLGFLSKRIMLDFPLNLYPLVVMFEDSVIIGIGNSDMDEFTSTPTCPEKILFPYFNLERTTQVFLPQILRQLLRRNLGVHALDIARSCTNLPYFTHVLELMLHQVLEQEATASKPIPDPLLPRIVAFIQEFPQFLETVCHCARKTEIALWPHLFSTVGNPIELFKSCHTTGKLATAASYLLIIQSLESPAVSRQHATLLLETVLDKHNWSLAKDLVRFLRAIGKGEESPPRTPQSTYTHKSSFHQNMTSQSMTSPFSMSAPLNLEDSFSGSGQVKMPLSRQNSRTSMQTATTNTRATSVSKDRSSSVKETNKTRPPNLKLKRDDSRMSNSNLKSVNIESCEHFYIEMILSRYARKLLSNYSLVDLGTFAAHLEFDLTPWLTKERFRAACVDNFIRAMSYTHDYFEWDYPKCNAVPTLGRGVSQISASTLQSTSEIATPTTPIESELSYPNTTVDGEIEARLISIRDENEPCDTFSDSVSIITSLDEMSNADGRGNMAATSPPTMSEIMTVLDQKHHLVKHRSTEKLKYVLEVIWTHERFSACRKMSFHFSKHQTFLIDYSN